MASLEQGLLSIDVLKDEDIFEIQHHHLLQCLEKATVRLNIFFKYGKGNQGRFLKICF